MRVAARAPARAQTRPIEFVAVTTELPAAASPKARALHLKNISGLSCC